MKPLSCCPVVALTSGKGSARSTGLVLLWCFLHRKNRQSRNRRGIRPPITLPTTIGTNLVLELALVARAELLLVGDPGGRREDNVMLGSELGKTVVVTTWPGRAPGIVVTIPLPAGSETSFVPLGAPGSCRRGTVTIMDGITKIMDGVIVRVISGGGD